MTLRIPLALCVTAVLSACGASSAPNAPAKPPAAGTPAPATASGAAASETNGDRFYSPLVGVSIEKRPSWVFMTLEMELANREAVSVGKQETDAAMHDGSTPPLVVISRYPEPSEKPNPTLKIVVRPLGELKGASPVELTRAVAASMAKAVPSFGMDADVQAVQVSGLEAGTFRAHFTVDVARLARSFPVKTQVWIVPRGDNGLIIAASDPSGGAENYEADFQAMFATIAIRK